MIHDCIGQDFPGLDIGKSPTTRKFIVVGHGEDKAEIFGRVLLNDPTTQFRTLQQYGTAFANMFQLSTTNSEVLRHIHSFSYPLITHSLFLIHASLIHSLTHNHTHSLTASLRC